MKNKQTLVKEISEKYGLNITIDNRLNTVSVKNRNSEKLAKANKIVAHLDLNLNK